MFADADSLQWLRKRRARGSSVVLYGRITGVRNGISEPSWPRALSACAIVAVIA